MSQQKPGDKGEKPRRENEGTYRGQANHVQLEDSYMKEYGRR